MFNPFMFSSWGIIFILLGPVVYLYGLISLIGRLIHPQKPNTSPPPDTPTSLDQLRHILDRHPQISLGEALKLLSRPTPPPIAPSPKPASAPVIQPTNTPFRNWYTDNSINLLLYLGAFLILAAALAFVGFQWGTITGLTKATIFTLINLLFLICGLTFRRHSNIAQAGITFTAIGALLLPILGSAWYLFVLKPMGINASETWLFTSLLCLALYAGLSYSLTDRFYVYLSSLTSYSLSFAMFSTLNLDHTYFLIFASLPSLLTIPLDWRSPSYHSRLTTPIYQTANLITALCVATSLLNQLSLPQPYSLAFVVGLGMITLFYLIHYYFHRSYLHLAASLALGPILLYLLTGYLLQPQPLQNAPAIAPAQHLILVLTAVTYLISAIVYRHLKNYPKEIELNLHAATILLIFCFLFTGFHDLSHFHFHLTLLSLAATGFFYFRLLNQPAPLFFTTLAPIISLYLINQDSTFFSHHPTYLSLAYTTIGTGFYYWFQTKPVPSLFSLVGLTSFAYLILGFLSSSGIDYLPGLNFFFLGLILHHAGHKFHRPTGVYLGTLLALMSIRSLNQDLDLPRFCLPYLLSAIGTVTYLIHTLTQIKHGSAYRLAGLATLGLVPLYITPGFTSHHLLIHPAICAYFAAGVFLADHTSNRRPSSLYLSGFMSVLGWFIYGQYLELTDTLVYTLPAGVYAFAVAYHRFISRDYDQHRLLSYLAAGIIYLPSFIMAFDPHPAKHVLTMMVTGILLLGLAINHRLHTFRYLGIAGIVLSVIPQTYTYLLTLPRWVILSLLGTVFISTAIYLLLKRPSTKAT